MEKTSGGKKEKLLPNRKCVFGYVGASTCICVACAGYCVLDMQSVRRYVRYIEYMCMCWMSTVCSVCVFGISDVYFCV